MADSGKFEWAENPGHNAVMEEMSKNSSQLPDNPHWHLDTLFKLADVVTRVEDNISEDDRATLIAIGGALTRYGMKEIGAGIQAKLALQRAANRREP